MALKKICFDKSIEYYLKNYNGYERSNCHVNVFQKFYDFNYSEIEANESSFKYVIGLFLGMYESRKICYLHSWIEINNEVIDVTVFANALVGPGTLLSGPEFEEARKMLAEDCKYMPLKTISNKQYNRELNELYYSKSISTPEKAAELLIRKWIEEAESSPKIKEQIEKYGYEYTKTLDPFNEIYS